MENNKGRNISQHLGWQYAAIFEAIFQSTSVYSCLLINRFARTPFDNRPIIQLPITIIYGYNLTAIILELNANDCILFNDNTIQFRIEYVVVGNEDTKFF